MSKVKVKTNTHGKRGRPFRVALESIPIPEPKITFDDFYNALVAADEILSNSCKISYVCSGNTLDVVTGESAQFTPPITLVTLRSQITEYALGAMRQASNPKFILINDRVRKIILPMGIIEVELTILDGNYRPVKNFDLKYFNYDVWKIPNPINEFNKILKEIYG